MTEDRQELIFDLLTKKAIYGLDDAEQQPELGPGV